MTSTVRRSGLDMDPIGMVEENISFWQHCHAADYRSMVEAMSCDDPEEAVFWQQEQAIDHERAWYSLNQLINPI